MVIPFPILHLSHQQATKTVSLFNCPIPRPTKRLPKRWRPKRFLSKPKTKRGDIPDIFRSGTPSPTALGRAYPPRRSPSSCCREPRNRFPGNAKNGSVGNCLGQPVFPLNAHTKRPLPHQIGASFLVVLFLRHLFLFVCCVRLQLVRYMIPTSLSSFGYLGIAQGGSFWRICTPELHVGMGVRPTEPFLS